MIRAIQDQRRDTATALERLAGTPAPETVAELGLLDDAMILPADGPDRIVHLAGRPPLSPELDRRIADLTRDLAAGPGGACQCHADHRG